MSLKRLSRFLLILAGSAVLSVAARQAEAESISPVSGAFVYVITRDGSPVGEQRIDISRQGARTTVVLKTQLSVTLLGLEIYGFRQDTEEVWDGDSLVSVRSDADDDGKPRKVKLDRQGDRLIGTYNETSRDADPRLPTTTFWDARIVKAAEVLDVFRGRERDVTVLDLGTVMLPLPMGAVQARHYRMEGEFKRELWYDQAGRLVAGQMTAKDGSTIRQELLSAPQ